MSNRIRLVVTVDAEGRGVVEGASPEEAAVHEGSLKEQICTTAAVAEAMLGPSLDAFRKAAEEGKRQAGNFRRAAEEARRALGWIVEAEAIRKAVKAPRWASIRRRRFPVRTGRLARGRSRRFARAVRRAVGESRAGGDDSPSGADPPPPPDNLSAWPGGARAAGGVP